MPSLDSFTALHRDWLAIEERVRAFELARQAETQGDWSSFLPSPSDAGYAAIVCELVRVDLELSWEKSEPTPLAEYLARFPEIASERELLSQVAFEEFRLRRAAGELPEPSEYSAEFGVDVSKWRASSQAAASFAARNALSDSLVANGVESPPAREPEVGDRLLGFHLVEQLGRGAVGRVFLAEQSDLANRRVVLKFSRRFWAESQTLAQLQHTNIVPILSCHRHDGWQVICMPYFGRATLEDLLRAAIDSTTTLGRAASGEAIVSTIRANAADATAIDGSRSTVLSSTVSTNETATRSDASTISDEIGERAIDGWRRDGYAKGVLRLVLGVARGLAHAHERGIVHCDLKPANVLFADDLRPMLLDFNLAAAGERQQYIGGSLPYMAPEAIAALDHRSQASGQQVSGPQSDLYSLGILAHELLSRERAPIPDDPRRAAPADWLATRCVPWPPCRGDGVTPAMRAIVAKCLATEPAERYPSALALCEDLERQLADLPLRHAGERSLWERVAKFRRRWPKLTSAATVSLAAAVVILAMTISTFAKLRQRDRLEATERARQTASEVREARLLLFQPDATSQEIASAVELCEGIVERHGVRESAKWWERGLAAELSQVERQQLCVNVGAALHLWAELGPKDAAQLERLSKSALGAGVAKSEPAEEKLSLAIETYRSGRFDAALEPVLFAVQETPESFEAWLLLGHCHAERGNHREAASAYSVCVALAPESEWAWFNRGAARLELGRFAEADADFTRVLKTQRRTREALVNRGLARMGQRRFKEAVDDFTTAIDGHSPTCRMYLLRARAFAALGDSRRAAEDRQRGLATDAESAADWVARGVARIGEAGAAALADFDAAIEMDVRCRDAWENRAAVLSADPAKLGEAIASLDELLTHYPEYGVGRMGRAVLLARRGDGSRAIDDAERALALDARPMHVYQAACVRALLSKQNPDQRFKAIELLASALRQGFGREIAMVDDDLAALREDPAFLALLSSPSSNP